MELNIVQADISQRLCLQDEDGNIVLNEHFDTQYEAPTEGE